MEPIQASLTSIPPPQPKLISKHTFAKCKPTAPATPTSRWTKAMDAGRMFTPAAAKYGEHFRPAREHSHSLSIFTCGFASNCYIHRMGVEIFRVAMMLWVRANTSIRTSPTSPNMVHGWTNPLPEQQPLKSCATVWWVHNKLEHEPVPCSWFVMNYGLIETLAFIMEYYWALKLILVANVYVWLVKLLFYYGVSKLRLSVPTQPTHAITCRQIR